MDNSEVLVGDEATYTISLINKGPSTATGVAVTDELPSEVQFISNAPSQGTYDATSGIWTVGELASGASATLNITVKVIAEEDYILNIAQVSAADQPDIDSEPNNDDGNQSEDDEDAVIIGGIAADLELVKNVDKTEVNIGDEVTFTITIQNQGGSTATGVVVNDKLPTGLSFVSSSPEVGTYDPATGNWTIGELLVGAIRNLEITATVDGIGPYSNVAQVSEVDQPDLDSTPGNNVPTEDDQDEASVGGKQIDLELTKEASVTSVVVGDQFDYVLTLTNKGPNDATGVMVHDQLPGEVKYISANPSHGTYSTGPGIWNIGNLAANDVATLTITVEVIDEATFTNVAQVSAADQPDIDSEPNNDDPDEDDQDDVSLGSIGLADLELMKEVDATVVGVGDMITYTLSLVNNGPSEATSVQVTDQLPASLQYVSADPSQGTYTSTDGLWNVGMLQAGAAAQLKITAIVIAAGDIINSAEITNSDQEDPDSTPDNNEPAEDDQDDVTITGEQIDLSLTKTSDATSVNVGEEFTYTLTINNTGPSTATNIDIQDNLPGNVQYISDSPSLGSYEAGPGIWNITSLTAGSSATLDIVVEVLAPGTFINTAQVVNVDQPDVDSTPNNDDPDEDDQASVPVTGEQIDLELSKTASATDVNVGDNVTYTLTLLNKGPSTATGVTVTDNLPSGVSFVSANPPAAYNDGTGIWTVGSLATGASTTLDITVQVLSDGLITNVAEVSAADQPDVDSEPGNDNPIEDDQDEISINGIEADLEVHKEVVGPTTTFNLGDLITFKITVENNGPAVATNIQVEDRMDPGLTFVGANPTNGTFNSTTLVWSLNELYPGEQEELIVFATIDAVGVSLNKAELIAVDQPDPDSEPNNDGLSEDDQDEVEVGAEQIDLSITKTADVTTVNVGDNFTYTIELANAGPNNAEGVVVFDELPGHVSYVTHTATLGTYSAGTGEWYIGTVNVGEPQTLTITVKAIEAGDFINTAQVSKADQPDIDSEPNNDIESEDDQQSVTVTGEQIDLELTKTASDTEVTIGTEFTYTLTLNNNGPSDATGVAVKDELPSGVTFVGANPAAAYNSTNGVWTVGSLAAGATTTLEITVTMQTEGIVTNIAEVSAADQPDIDSEPDSNISIEDDQDEVTVGGTQADLELTKVVNQQIVGVGADVTFTIMVENNGSARAKDVTVRDVLPAGLVFVSADPSVGTYNSTTGVWTVGEIYVGESETLDIVANVSGAGSFTNIAEVTNSDQPDPDSTPDNGDGTEDDQDEVTVIGQLIDLSLVKTADVTEATVGDVITYSITLSNEGPADATGVEVHDQLPGEVSFLSSATSTGTYSSGSGIWNVGNLAAGAIAKLDISVTVEAEGTFKNIAQVSAADQPDVDSDPNNDDGDQSEDDESAATAGSIGLADLELQKTASESTVGVGDMITYTLNIVNNGPSSADNVEVTDLLPTGLTFVSADPSQGTYTAASGIWAIGTLQGGASANLDITATVTQAGDIINSAEITNSDQEDPDSTPDNNEPAEDDQDVTTITAESADLSLTKTADVSQSNVGDQIVYTITLANAGPSTATNVVILEDLPSQVSFVNADPSLGTYNSETSEWTIGELPAGASEILYINVTVDQPGTFTNSTQIIASDQPDPNSTPNNNNPNENDQSSVDVTGLQIDLQLIKTANAYDINVGDNVTFTLQLDNIGYSDATGVEVRDFLTAGELEYVSSTGDGTYNDATGTWTVGSLPSGGVAFMNITAKVLKDGPVINYAEVSNADQPDKDSEPDNNISSEDDQDQITINGIEADLEVHKEVVNESTTFNLGDLVTFMITVENNGAAKATNVQIEDRMDPGLTFVGANPTNGTFNSTTLVWTLTELYPGEQEQLEVIASIDEPGIQINKAELIAVDQPDPDSEPGNDALSEDDQDEVNVGAEQIDLSLTKTASTGSVNVGETFTYTIMIANSGLNNAMGVVVFDQLPGEVSYVSQSATQGTYSPATGEWNVGTVNTGEDETLTITVKVEEAGSFVNTAQVTAANQPDFDSTPNNDVETEDDQQSVEVTGEQIDLELTKTASDMIVGLGDETTYTLTLTNNGPSAATGVAVTDKLPAGVSFVSANPAAAYSSATGLWTVGNLAAGASLSLDITVKVNIEGTISNTAQVTAADQPDVDSETANNVPTEDDQDRVVIGSEAADLELYKTVDKDMVGVGDEITFTIRVENNGSANANDVKVTDVLPADLTFVSASPTVGTYSQTSGLWNIGELYAGEKEFLHITAIVSKAGSYTNIAEVTASNLPDPDSTPDNGDATEDDQDEATVTGLMIDLALSKTADASEVKVGDEFTYTLTLSNDGPAMATGINVTETLPAEVKFVSAKALTGFYNNNTGVWSISSLAAEAITELEITVEVTDAGDIVNLAQVTKADQPDSDSTPGNDDGDQSEDDESSATVGSTGVADLELIKDIINVISDIEIGDNITYRLTLFNNGPSDASGITVQDVLPAGVEYAFSSPPAVYDQVSGTWTVGSLTAGSTITLDITVKILEGGAITNEAQVMTSDQHDPDSTPGNNIKQEDDHDEVIITPGCNAYSGALLPVGDGDACTDEKITAMLASLPSIPAGYQVAYLLTSGADKVIEQMSTVPQFGPLEVGDYMIHTLVYDSSLDVAAIEIGVTKASDINAMLIQGGGSICASLLMDGAAFTVKDCRIDINLTKVADKEEVNVGENVVYTVTVTNDGPGDATGVQAFDQLEGGLTHISSIASLGTYSSGSGIWNIGKLPQGVSAVLTITARVDAAGPINNSAQVSAANEDDMDSTPNNNIPDEDDQEAVEITGIQVDMELTKIVTPSADLEVGDQVIYTIAIMNEGPSDATGVQVTDKLPDGTAFVEVATISQGAYDETSGLWDIGAIANGAAATLEVRVEITDDGMITNTAELTALDQPDIDSEAGNDDPTEDDQDQVTISVDMPPAADLSVIKTVSSDLVKLGQNVVFTILVQNDGPSFVEDVIVKDLMPTGLTFVEATTTTGTYDATTGLWSIASLSVGESETMEITATLSDIGPFENVAEVQSSSLPDPDSTPDNNIPDEDDQDSAIVGAEAADLSLTKVADVDEANVGEQVLYTLELTNNGPSNATGVMVFDQLPSEVSFVKADASTGTFSPATGQWNVGTILNGETEVLYITVTVDEPGTFKNIAQIAESDQPDPDSTPNNNEGAEDDQDEAGVTGVQIDLQLIKTASPAIINVGDDVTYTLQLDNIGYSDATGVVVLDKLPEGLTYVTHATASGNYDETTGHWTVGNLPSGEKAILSIAATVDKAGEITNIAQVVDADQPDEDSYPSNNDPNEDDQDEVTIGGVSADLSVTKKVDNPEAGYGDNVTYTITAKNNGGNNATGVKVTDVLPDSLAYVSSDASIGSYDATTGIWTIGNMGVGQMETLDITAEIIGTGAIINLAEITGNETDPDSTNDKDSVQVSGVLVDLELTKTARTQESVIGDFLAYSITVLNNSDFKATGVEVYDYLPGGVQYVSSNPSSGTYNPNTGLWLIGDLEPQEQVLLEIFVDVVEPGAITNSAQVTAVDQPDKDSTPNNNDPDEDDQDEVTMESVAQIDLELIKEANMETAQVGDEVIYTLNLLNKGPAEATNIKVTDILPEGLTYVSAVANNGFYLNTDGIWSIGKLAAGDNAVLTLTVTVTQSGEIVNIAEVIAVDQPDIDSEPNNQDPKEDDQNQSTIEVEGEKGSIGDYVWFDENGDGIQDAGEMGIPNVTITITYPDGSTTTTVTNDEGLYLFDNLPAGEYIITVGDGPEGTSITTVTTYTITIGEGEDNLTADFGFDGIDLGSIGDYVWMDANGDGIQDAGETGIPNVTITLTYPDGSTATTSTDGEGFYLFNNLPEGTYNVTVGDGPAGTELTTTDNYDVTLAAGEDYMDADFGFDGIELGSIGDYVWMDTNGDGIQDAGETGIPNVTITITYPDGSTTTMVTNDEGLYLFDNLPAGEYIITVGDGPEGTSITTVTTYTVTIGEGEDNLTADFGFDGVELGSIGDYVWMDANGDGIQDAGETGIPNVTITITYPDGSTTTTVTNDEGLYLFDNLPAGEYIITVGDGPEGTSITTVTIYTITIGEGEDNLTADFGFDGIELGSIGDYVWMDANGDGIQDAGETGIPNVTITLTYPDGSTVTTSTDGEGFYLFNNLPEGTYNVTVGEGPAGTELTTTDNYDVTLAAGEDYMDADFGFDGIELGSIGDYVWMDTNGDGIQDAGEMGIPNVTITITYPDGSTTTTVTNDEGLYLFDNLPAGEYIITVGDGPEGTSITTVTTYTITIGEGEDNLTADFGFDGIELGSIGDYVWYDENANGIQDPGETGIPNITVTLKDETGEIVAITTTDDLGKYLFVNLPSGNYIVEVGSGPEDSTITTPATYNVTLGEGEDYLDADFGFDPAIICTETSDVGNLVFHDLNLNGERDLGEPGILGVTISLLNADGNVIQTTTTNGDGEYLFTSLPLAWYKVMVGDGPQGLTVVQNIFEIDTECGEDFMDADFAFQGEIPQPGSIGDRVWNDKDNDGIQDAGEPGIVGVTVTLTDFNGNVIATTTTDANGNYLFTDLEEGAYTVTVSNGPIGYELTTVDSYNVNITSGLNYKDADFGFYQEPDPELGSIGDFVWMDENGNSVQDPGEPGIPGVSITLNLNGEPIANTITNNDGEYVFVNLPAGDYTVTVGSGPTGTTLTTPNNVEVSLNEGQDYIDADFGFYQEPDPELGSIGDMVWYDTNGDGLQSPGETGIPGVTITLYDNNENVIATDITNNSGTYSFDNLPAGEYTVVVGAGPMNTYLTTETEFVIVLGDGEDYDMADFGFAPVQEPTPGTVTGIVWNDEDNDGQIDAGEKGIANVTITLLDKDGNTVATTTTDGSGHYTFTNVEPGDYTVVVGEGPEGTTITTVTTYNITVDEGETDSGSNFGFYETPDPNLGSIDGYVWTDTNGNGQPDPGETGIANVIITLIDENGNTVATTTTNDDGQYSFTNIPEGNYTVVVGEGPDGTELTTTNTYTITITDEGENITDIDFGFDWSNGSITGIVYNDDNENGIQDKDEKGIGGVTVTLVDENGNTVATTTTNEDGSYTFEEVEPGDYTVVVGADPNGGDLTTSGNVNITITPGNNTEVDFGFDTPAGTVTGIVFNDKNGNGIQDPGEEGLPGISVSIIDSNTGQVIATTITDENGNYTFDNVPTGEYNVIVGEGPEGTKPSTPTSQTITVENNSTTNVEFGFEPQEGTITGIVFDDQNGNGIQDPGENGLSGITVTITDENGNVIETTTTDNNGNYTFENVPVGNYNVVIGEGPEGTKPSTPTSQTITVTHNTTSTVEFGFAPKEGTVVGSVFDDQNGNGIKDVDEGGIEGITVTLVDENGNIIATVITDENGNYSFTNVPEGNYTVVISEGPEGTKATTSTSQTITVTDGSTINVEFGFETLKGTIGDMVWVDENQDQTIDDSEAGLAGATVQLIDFLTNQIVDETTTDVNGHYLFENVEAGRYIIKVLTNTIPNDYGPTTALTYEYILAPGEDYLDADFGFFDNSIQEECDIPVLTICTEPMQPVDICPDFCYENYEVVEAKTTFSCSIKYLGECIKYTALPDFYGPDVIEIIACDLDGTDCDTAYVNIQVGNCDPLSGNEAPTAVADETTTDEGTSVNINVLANDTDPEDDTLTVGSFTQPANGTVILNSDGSFTYTPNAGFTGVDVFTYQACDDENACSTTSVKVNVLPDDCSDVINLCAEPVEKIEICPDFCDFAPNDEYIIISANTTYNCSIKMKDDGCIEYRALPLFAGEETITIIGQNSAGLYDTVTVVVQVTGCDGKGFEDTTDEFAAQSSTFKLNSIMPVPAVDHIQVSFTASQEPVTLQIYDVSGRLIEQLRVNANKGLNVQRLDIANYPQGIYVLSLSTATETVNAKFMKQ